jgi:hypothetical protein
MRIFTFSSTLSCEIIENEHQTIVRTKAHTGVKVLILLILTFIAGCAYLIKGMLTGLSEFIGWGIVLTVLGPAISIGVTNVAKASIEDRYFRYIHKALLKSATTV